MAVVAFAMWFVGSAGPAQACSCAAPPDDLDPAEQERLLDLEADTIIVGRAVAVTEHPGDDPAMGQLEYTFRVDVLHKGEITDPVSLWTANNGGMCGERLELDQSYKLYPRRSDDGRYRIGLCNGNRPATEADLEPIDFTPSTTATTGVPRATTSTGPPARVTTSTSPPFGTSTSSSSTSVPATIPSITTPPPSDDAAIAIDDDSDDDGTGVLLPAMGGLAAAAVGTAAFALWRARNGALPSAPAPPGLPPMPDVNGGGRRLRR